MIWRFHLLSLFIVLFSLFSLADTLQVAGHERELARPFIVSEDEVLAPLIPSLKFLGIKAFIRNSAVSLVMPEGTVCKLNIGSTKAEYGKEIIKLSLAPRKVGAEIYLPVFQLIPLLRYKAIFDEDNRTLSLLPLLQVSCEKEGDESIIVISSTAPLNFSKGTLTSPPRAYFDFQQVSLDNETMKIPINAGNIKQLRLHRRDATPASVRLTADLNQSVPLKVLTTADGRKLTILAGGRNVGKLTSAALNQLSGKRTEVVISTKGSLAVESKYERSSRSLSLVFKDGMSSIKAEELKAMHDNRIKKVALYDLPAKAGVKLVIYLKQNLEYFVQQQQQAVRVVVGASNLKGMIIVLDAGHGGFGDEGRLAGPGAVGENGTTERETNLDVIQRLAKLLKPTGAKIYLTRSDDGYVSLEDRVALANEKNADILVAVHCNSSVNHSATGTEIYYLSQQSAELACCLHKVMVKELDLKDRGVRNDQELYIIKFAQMPAVLEELAFISNKDEEALLASAEFRQKAAEALANGIRNYAAACDWRSLRNSRNAGPKEK